jgi:hypothetical protein
VCQRRQRGSRFSPRTFLASTTNLRHIHNIISVISIKRRRVFPRIALFVCLFHSGYARTPCVFCEFELLRNALDTVARPQQNKVTGELRFPMRHNYIQKYSRHEASDIAVISCPVVRFLGKSYVIVLVRFPRKIAFCNSGINDFDFMLANT